MAGGLQSVRLVLKSWCHWHIQAPMLRRRAEGKLHTNIPPTNIITGGTLSDMQYTPNKGLCVVYAYTQCTRLTKVSWRAPPRAHADTECILNNTYSLAGSYSSAAVHTTSWWMLGRKGERCCSGWSTMGADGGGDREKGVHYIFVQFIRCSFLWEREIPSVCAGMLNWPHF